jgi:hypothetical protein
MMNDSNNPYFSFPGITPEEMNLLQQATADLNENQLRNFQMMYMSRRKNAQDILLFTLLGFVCVAGIQRFVLGQTLMGILYVCTAGFCGIGTLVDLINNKNLTNDYNRDVIYETYQMAKMGS